MVSCDTGKKPASPKAQPGADSLGNPLILYCCSNSTLTALGKREYTHFPIYTHSYPMCHSKATAFTRQPKPYLPLILSSCHDGWYSTDDSTRPGDPASQSPTYTIQSMRTATALLSLTATLWRCYCSPTHYAFIPMFSPEHVTTTQLCHSTIQWWLYLVHTCTTLSNVACRQTALPLTSDLSGLSASRPIPYNTARIVCERISRMYAPYFAQ